MSHVGRFAGYIGAALIFLGIALWIFEVVRRALVRRRLRRGLICHFSADEGVVTDANGNVIEWKDISGSGNHLRSPDYSMTREDWDVVDRYLRDRWTPYGPEDLPPDTKSVYLEFGEGCVWEVADVRSLRMEWDAFGCRIWYQAPMEPKSFFPVRGNDETPAA